MSRLAVALLGLVAIGGVAAAARSAAAAPPTGCAGTRAHLVHAPILALDPEAGAPRVFAVQLHQQARDVATYASFRRRIDCVLRADVLPHRALGRPNVVAFDEDTGLATGLTGSRGARARAIMADPGGVAQCAGQGFPCRTLDLLDALDEAYAKPEAYYAKRLTGLRSFSRIFVAATDTFARGFMATFAAEAKRYGLYVSASSDQAPFRMSSDPAAIRALADPDLAHPPRAVAVATSAKVHNETFLWGPRDVRRSGPAVLRNVVARNLKVPLVGTEQLLQLTPGPAGGAAARANLRPYALPGTRARIGFATSLPAFAYGRAGGDPCADVATTYMRCLDALGANLVLQSDANPGPWTGPDGDGVEQWQPLSWMTSTWRAVTDPAVHFAYDVTPMLVGNLGDLVFDGQSAITQRGGAAGPGCRYVGDGAFVPGEDRDDLTGDAGAKPDFLAIAPWAAPDGPRDALRAVSAQLAPASGDAREDDYPETTLVADLPFPVDPARRGCAT